MRVCATTLLFAGEFVSKGKESRVPPGPALQSTDSQVRRVYRGNSAKRIRQPFWFLISIPAFISEDTKTWYKGDDNGRKEGPSDAHGSNRLGRIRKPGRSARWTYGQGR